MRNLALLEHKGKGLYQEKTLLRWYSNGNEFLRNLSQESDFCALGRYALKDRFSGKRGTGS